MSPTNRTNRFQRWLRFCPAVILFLISADSAGAGWWIERVSRTEGASGPSATVTLEIAGGRVKERHPDGTYFLWDVPRRMMFQVDPQTKSYSGGKVSEMVEQVNGYLDDLRKKLAKLTDEQRQTLAERNPGMPMPAPLPEKPPQWTVHERDATERITGHAARLFEIYRDGALFEQKWIAASVDLGSEIDWKQFSRLNTEMRRTFAAGMGSFLPDGPEIEALAAKGIEMRSVLVGEGVRVVTELTRIEEREVPATTFHLPSDYLLRGQQSS